MQIKELQGEEEEYDQQDDVGEGQSNIESLNDGMQEQENEED